MNIADLSLVGAGRMTPVLPSGQLREVYLDNAASTQSFWVVKDQVDERLLEYSSVGRGASWWSKKTTKAYNEAREDVRQFVNAADEDCVVFTRNTTDSVNLLVSALPLDDSVIVCWESDHHAALLPGQRRTSIVLPVPSSPENALDDLERALKQITVRHCLVIVTGASNVTGEIWPYEAITRIAHEHDSKVLLDAAQLAPHVQIDMTASGVDFICWSGHKMYAPYGTGVLVARYPCGWFETAEPFLAGGGAVDFVRVGDVGWAELPDRQEAGSPNVLGAIALATACRTLQSVTMTYVTAKEMALTDVLSVGLADIPGITFYRMWSAEHPRIGVLTFNFDETSYMRGAMILATEHAVGSRGGCFCAHPLMIKLLDIDDERACTIAMARRQGDRSMYVPGAIRVSLGLGNSINDLISVLTAVLAIAKGDIRWTYKSSPDGTSCWPINDRRE